MKVIISIIAVLFLLPLGLFSQKTIFNGRLWDNAEHKGAENIRVINVNNGYGTISKKNGYFAIFASDNDTLLITSVQYENIRMAVNPSSDTVVIQMKTNLYILPEVEIFKYSNYNDFKRAVVTLPYEKVAPKEIPWFKEYFSESKREYTSVNTFSPISYFYDKYSKAALEKKRYNYILGIEKMDELVSTKYNSEIVSRITGLTSMDEIKRFMDYCHLQDTFIVKAKEYELYLAILNCYHQFSK